MALRVGVDFDRNGFMALDAKPGDSLNLFGTVAADLSKIKLSFTPTNTTRLLMGTSRVQVQKSNASATADNFGYDGVNADVVASAGVYTMRVWVSTSAATVSNVRFMMDGTSIGSTTTLQAGGYYQVTGTVTGSNRKLWVEITSARTFVSGYISVNGIMIVSGSSAPVGFNCGLLSTYENVTRWVETFVCSYGFDRAYEQVAKLEEADIRLNNDDKLFSPEYVGGALYGQLKAGRLVAILEGTRVLWVGWTDNFQPEPGSRRTRKCALRCSGFRRFFQGKRIYPDIVSNVTIKDAVETVIDLVSPPQLGTQASSRIYDGFVATSYNREGFIDIGATFDTVAQTGLGFAPYYFDADENGTDAANLLGYMMKAMGGKLWFEPDSNLDILIGLYGGVNGDNATPLVTITGTEWIGLDYVFGEPIVNEVTARAYRRKLSASTTRPLWEMNETLTIEPGESEELRVEYRDAEQNTEIAALSSSVVETVTADAGVTWTLDAGVRSAVFTFTNTRKRKRNVTAASLVGQTLKAFQPVERVQSDMESIALYGVRGLSINSKWISKPRDAKELTGHWCSTLAGARGVVKMVEVLYSAAYGALRIGDIVRISDAQTGHDERYVVIGLRHEADQALLNHTVQLYVERLGMVATIGVETRDKVTADSETAPMIGMY